MTLDNSRLKRIRYESSGGSMCFHSEFEIEADAAEVIRTAYWSDVSYSLSEDRAEPGVLEAIDSTFRTSEKDEMTVREHIPMNTALWDALCEELGYLWEQLRPVEKRSELTAPDPDMFVLDGGDYQRLYLTRERDGTEQTVQYYPPSGNRWYSVIEILREMVRPVGRDLCRIGETLITELYLKAPEYSYQITPAGNSGGYYYFVHGDSSDRSSITREQWLTVRDYLSGLDIPAAGSGSGGERYSLRLKYNDGISREVKIDKGLAEEIRGFLKDSI